MDFKVAGTEDFITALQLDTKLAGIPASVLAQALDQAKDARTTLLEVMAEAIDGPDEMSLFAPRIITINIPVDKIGEVIGPKGKVINQIQDDTGAQISIEDDGTIYVGADSGEKAEAARALINAIANPTMPEKGERYLGTVVKITAFGAFVSLLPGKDGLLHISKLRPLAGGARVENVEDVVSVGQKIQVEINEIDDRGKLSLIPVVEEEASPSEHPPPRPAAPRRPAGVTPSWVAPCRRTALPHGLRVVTERMAVQPHASALGFFAGVGSRHETRRAARRLALPRARAVQGHGRGGAPSRSRPPSSRSAVS